MSEGERPDDGWPPIEREAYDISEIETSDGNLDAYRFETPERHPKLQESDLRDAYGDVRGWFRYRAREFDALDHTLRASRTDVPVDEYLTRSARLAVRGGVVGGVIGLLSGFVMASSLGFPLGLVALFVSPLVGALLGGGAVWTARRYLPSVRAYRRARHTDYLLPQTVVFLYALSHGGLDLFESMEQLRESTDVHGEAAMTYDRIVDDVRWFNRDLFAAIAAARDIAPGDATETFLDELVSVLETGGNVDEFLENEANRHLELAEQKHEQLLDELETLAEAYVTVVFAGPIFLLVILMVVSFLQPGLFIPMQALVYVGMPLSVLVIWVWSSYLTEPQQDSHPGRQLSKLLEGGGTDEYDDDRIIAYEREHHQTLLGQFLTAPLETLQSHPHASLLVSAPIAAVVSIGLFVINPFPTSAPVATSSALFAIPFVITTAPYAYFHERRRRHERRVRDRFPAALKIMADGDENGLPLVESLELVTSRTSGHLSDELDRVRRDVAWHHDLVAAFERFSTRLGVPEVKRSTRLVTSSIEMTDDLAPVLDIVSENLRIRNDLRTERRRHTLPYVLVVFVGVGVYLFIVVFFETHFLPVVAEAADASGSMFEGTALNLGSVDGSAYRRLFFHSVLIQATLNGLLVGTLVDGRAASGLKYAIGMVAVSTAVFIAVA
ncbi:MAG: flagellar protein FlaJ [Natronomonas sp.]|jgi:flagellar protein FlaJ|uniref:type II secretion system F family protein n=1 Tax=Natronomonas sp. TaxID=2184060 RepID=UPI003989C129